MITCPSCGEENPERARFCLNCATPLGLENEARPELKFATALFADLVGSTTLAEREDPEVVQSVVGRSFDRLSVDIERYGGLLEKFMGDAMLAVFGVPKSHEDDPERAVRASLEMQAVLSELNHGFAAEGKPQLAMRIGVEAGDVLVDIERAAGPRDRMLTGDAVNTAARLEAAADPGHVVVGPTVFASTKDVIDFREIAPLSLKGKGEPVPAGQALRVRRSRRGERPSLGLEARLIGRDEEMTVFKQTLHRVETEGRPAMVTIVGPAGVGKSRVTSELSRYVEGLPQFIYWRSGRCLAYGNTPYSALADAIKAECEVLEDDAADVVARRSTPSSRSCSATRRSQPRSARWWVEARRRRSPARSCSRRGGGSSSGWPRATRWCSRSTICIGRTRGCWIWWSTSRIGRRARSCFWCRRARSCSTSALPGRRQAQRCVDLPRLADAGRGRRDDRRSAPGEITDELRKLIVERSEGNPLYTEEMVRMLIDRGVLRATKASRWRWRLGGGRGRATLDPGADLCPARRSARRGEVRPSRRGGRRSGVLAGGGGPARANPRG